VAVVQLQFEYLGVWGFLFTFFFVHLDFLVGFDLFFFLLFF
jgi:hypothetical protein